MSMFDFRYVPAPKGARISLTPVSAAEVAAEKADLIARLRSDGWSYVTTERDPDATGVFARQAERMVFRRPRDSRAPEGRRFAPSRLFAFARRPKTPRHADYEADVKAAIRELAPLMRQAA